jgi:predicted KAP-like P-loop ATPase
MCKTAEITAKTACLITRQKTQNCFDGKYDTLPEKITGPHYRQVIEVGKFFRINTTSTLAWCLHYSQYTSTKVENDHDNIQYER